MTERDSTGCLALLGGAAALSALVLFFMAGLGASLTGGRAALVGAAALALLTGFGSACWRYVSKLLDR